jgi:hypothetical protein
MMESWVDKDEAFFDKPGQSKIRIKTTSAFDTQYSNIPPFHFSKGRLKVDSNPPGEITAGSPGLGFFTSCAAADNCKAVLPLNSHRWLHVLWHGTPHRPF